MFRRADIGADNGRLPAVNGAAMRTGLYW
jgi:hypothetical protein